MDHDKTEFKASLKSIPFHPSFIENIKFRKQEREKYRKKDMKKNLEKEKERESHRNRDI